MRAQVTKLPASHENLAEKHSAAFRSIEGAICDLYRMSQIATEAIYEVEEAHDEADRADRMEIAVFAAEQLRKLIGEFKDEYYRYHNG